MNLIHKVINKILSIYYRSSGERLLSYYKCGGVKIGEGTIIFDSKNILIDTSRPELLEIGKHVFLHAGTTILTHDWASW